MVTVKVVCAKDLISSIEIEGHAGFEDSGKDLVCAGASSISIGALNALDQLFKNDCILEMKENRISIKVKESKKGLEQVLRCIVIQLETMVESYPEYIRIIRKEV